MPEFLRFLAQHWALIITGGGIVLVLSRGLLALWGAVRPLWVNVGAFLEDWRGEDARPGRAARPGVLERIAAIESATEVHGRTLAELRPNGGGSIKDTINRIDRRTKHLNERLDAVERVVVPDQPDDGEGQQR